MIGFLILFRKSVSPCDLPTGIFQLIEKITDRHAQDIAELEQTACADAVKSALILLNLLESNADGVSELFLAPAQYSTPLSEASADMLVN